MSELFRHSMPTRGGLDDMLMGLNISPSSTNLIPLHPFVPNGYGGQRDGGYRHNNQRSGYNNYNNQRGQYKHNQNNSNSQYNNNRKLTVLLETARYFFYYLFYRIQTGYCTKIQEKPYRCKRTKHLRFGITSRLNAI